MNFSCFLFLHFLISWFFLGNFYPFCNLLPTQLVHFVAMITTLHYYTTLFSKFLSKLALLLPPPPPYETSGSTLAGNRVTIIIDWNCDGIVPSAMLMTTKDAVSYMFIVDEVGSIHSSSDREIGKRDGKQSIQILFKLGRLFFFYWTLLESIGKFLIE